MIWINLFAISIASALALAVLSVILSQREDA